MSRIYNMPVSYLSTSQTGGGRGRKRKSKKGFCKALIANGGKTFMLNAARKAINTYTECVKTQIYREGKKAQKTKDEIKADQRGVKNEVRGIAAGIFAEATAPSRPNSQAGGARSRSRSASRRSCSKTLRCTIVYKSVWSTFCPSPPPSARRAPGSARPCPRPGRPCPSAAGGRGAYTAS